MIGRKRELAVIANAVEKPGGSAGVAITGTMGVGKSRLAREALAGCGRISVNWAAGSSAAQAIQLGAFVRWLPAYAPDPLRAANGVIAQLLARAGSRPCVVAVDDANLLDDTSAFMLQQLIQQRRAYVVLTVGTDVAVSESVAALLRDERLRRVDLLPLGHAECAELLESVLDGPVDPVSERLMWRLTRGNVRFMRHIVEQELDAGRLRRNDGTWIWLPGTVIPSPVCELIEHQIGELPDAVAETVDLLSVAEPLTSQILIDLVGAGPIEDAEKRSLITVDGDDAMVRLAHPLIGAVRRIRAGHIRLRRLRGLVASRLESRGDPAVILRRGALLLESDVVVTGEEMVHAAEVALWRGDVELALRFAEAARLAGGGWRASLACAEALTMAGRLSEAQSSLAGQNALPEAVAAMSVGHAKSLFLQGRIDEALVVLQRGEIRSAGSDSSALTAMRAFIAASDGNLGAATQAADVVLDCDELPEFSTMLAQTAKTIAMGEFSQIDDLEPVVTAARVLGDGSTATSILRFVLAEAHSSALQLSGYPAAAAAVVDGIRDDDQPPEVDRWVTMMSGSASLASGLVHTAVRQLRDALCSQRPDFLGGWLCRYNIDLAIALAVLGESAAAQRCLDRIVSQSHPDMAFLEPMEMLAAAWISASAGAVTRAIEEARTAAVTAAVRGLPAREVLCLQTATRFGDPTTAARLDELEQVVGGRRASAAAAHAAALGASSGEGLMAASNRYAAMGDVLSALDAAAQASSAFRRSDRRGSALSATGRVRELAEGCGDVHTPALADAAAPPVFSGREREVIKLVGSGLTNREIAERLQLSVRTVEGHLYRAAGRVGARDRNELARVIGEALAVPV